jgi:transcriptional regulator GlxA family with amidase domain
VTVDDLARRATVSPRTLARRFRTRVGGPPGGWLRRERVLLAQRLLEMRHDPLAEIARKAGYASATTLRAQFASRLGTAPRDYRQGFRRPA